jgi:hypothetical protein
VPVESLPGHAGPVGEQGVRKPGGTDLGQQLPGDGQDVTAGALDARMARSRAPPVRAMLRWHPMIIQIV